jgi:putative membrane protein
MTRKFLIVGAALAALSLAACGPKTDETKGAATPAEQAATPDANPAATVPTPSDETKADVFVAKAAATDMYEVEAAKLVAKRSTNADVKAFAAKMGKAHTKTTEDLKAAIAASGAALTPPTMLPADLQDKLDDLTKADAKDFDKTYADDQVDVHQAALNLMQRYAQDGDTPAIKAFAAATAPAVQEHLNMAEGLKNGFDTGKDVANAQEKADKAQAKADAMAEGKKN